MASALTQSIVNKLSTGSRKLVSDPGCSGLYLDVRPTAASYRFRYIDRQKKQRAETIGDARLIKLSEARSIARDMARRLALGEDLKARVDLASTHEQQFITFRAFVEHTYLPQAYLTRRGLSSEVSTLNRHILPGLGDQPLTKITKSDVASFIHGLLAKGLAPSTVNRALAHIRCIFNRAIEWEIDGVEKNPAKGIKPVSDNRRHERYLSPEEAQRLLETVYGSSNKLLPFIVAFLLLTGCRKREVLDARWEHIDLDRGVLTIPLSKSGKPRYVPLSLAAQQVLLQARAMTRQTPGSDCSDGWVFPNPKTGAPFVRIQESWDTARRRAGLKALRIHDLRHSFASALVNSGMTLYEVKEALGHSSIVTTERYAHLAPRRLMQAVSSAQEHYRLKLRGQVAPDPNEAR